jgi:hypothetical protein
MENLPTLATAQKAQAGPIGALLEYPHSLYQFKNPTQVHTP